VQRIIKDQGARYVAGIGEGNPVGTLTRQAEDDDEGAPVPVLPAGTGMLSAEDREKLAGVLRELLDCKRTLERAREG
jgi:hypothetical protein